MRGLVWQKYKDFPDGERKYFQEGPVFLDSYWTSTFRRIRYLFCQVWHGLYPDASILQDNDRIMHHLIWVGSNTALHQYKI